ncbi:DUF1178 family protein [Sphingomonas abietis]|uniref:DUF1178 family protein n=1 Tax=Sphingomonas abietis TaxID=3012344 RepID=A0ABY7NKN7_9SPHN|nr:DUF1178 family protein [Sphingomonas abietis]WBO21178.1 DUF1178 family protein [Sphingomonas abietis]
MIVFDLACSSGHVFEAWFGSQADYDDQHARHLVSCPICGDGDVGKAPMAPRISTGGKGAPDARAVMQAMMMAQAKMLAGSEDVGSRFAAEARAIHVGDAENRVIHGQATPTEAKMLVEEGVPVAPLPFPVRDPARDN